MKVLSLAEIAATPHVAAAAAERTLGPVGATVVTITIVLSSIGAANGGIMTSPRTYFAQARDGLFFQHLAQIHPRFKTPFFAILLQGVWTSVLTLSGSYETLFSYTLFASWLFHAMTVVGVLILRRRYPELPRPYRMWGYPVSTIFFLTFALWLVLNTLMTRPGSSLVGCLIVASGIPMYCIWRKNFASRMPSDPTRNPYDLE